MKRTNAIGKFCQGEGHKVAGPNDIASRTRSAAEADSRATRQKTRGELATLNKKLDDLISGEESDLAPTVQAYLYGDSPSGKSRLELVLEALVERAASGDVKAAALLFDRAFGRVHENKQASKNINQIALTVSQLISVSKELDSSSSVKNATGSVTPENSTPETGWPVIEPRLPAPRVASPENSDIIDV